MNCYLITYDLLATTKDYKPLYDHIKTYEYWWHHMESIWLISTIKGIQEVSDALKKLLDDNDNLLVVDITGRNRSGWLTRKAWDWMSAYNPRV